MDYRKDFDPLSHAVIGAAIEVHRVLGPGFLEVVYEQALGVELGLRGISFAPQHVIGIAYKGKAGGGRSVRFAG
jgi:GxxExxY protein